MWGDRLTGLVSGCVLGGCAGIFVRSTGRFPVASVDFKPDGL
jgi:hypothetical protein